METVSERNMKLPGKITYKTILTGTIFMLAVVLSSCDVIEEIEAVGNGKYDSLALQWNPSLALPLGQSSFAMDEASGFDTLLFETDPTTGLPVWTELDEVVLEGRVEFDISDMGANVENILRLLVRLNIHNGFPDPMRVQAYFLIPDSLIIDSLFKGGPLYIPEGQLAGSDCGLEASTLMEDVIIPGEELPPLLDATELLLQASFLTSDIDTGKTYCYPFYLTEMEIGVMLDLSIDVQD